MAFPGEVLVTRSSVNMRNGGYTWTVEFLHDVDGPHEQKVDLLSLKKRRAAAKMAVAEECS
eukprot:scaffold12987_cov56-Cyclotella_meneghiniana.AAC.3